MKSKREYEREKKRGKEKERETRTKGGFLKTARRLLKDSREILMAGKNAHLSSSLSFSFFLGN